MIELAHIDAKHFNAGAELFEGEVINAPPILRYMLGWPKAKVERYCAAKGWTLLFSEVKQ